MNDGRQAPALVAALAARFAAIRQTEIDALYANFASDPDRMPARAFLGLYREIDEALAREALRVAEFARRECVLHPLDDPASPRQRHYLALTLPPDDWNPPA